MSISTMMSPDAIAGAANCPAWCTGNHSATYGPHHHAAANCPRWCTGHLDRDPEAIGDPRPAGEHGDDSHTGASRQVDLSLPPHIDVFSMEGRGHDGHVTISDYLTIQLWQGEACEVPDQPCIGIMHGADDSWLPDMTPAEALALAASLAQAAWQAQAEATDPTPANGPGDCPPWCETPDHQREDGGQMLHTLTLTTGGARYSRQVEDEHSDQPVLVTRAQARNQEPVIVIERPAGEADDPDGLLSASPAVRARQLMLGSGEAAELAVSLLTLTASPEGPLTPGTEVAR